VNLTVAEHRAPARALYERLGFRTDEAFVAHRSWEG
jgi:ribosomal protein S18 acetylase RimI-like enzyme